MNEKITTTAKHLWEFKHPFFGPDGEIDRYKSWYDFLDAWKDCDNDMNFLIRWDWPGTYIDENDDDIQIVPKDDYYRAYTLILYFVLPRKSKFIECHVDVCRADEPGVIEFLKKKFEYMKLLWEGITV